jgi:hypothetical protein
MTRRKKSSSKCGPSPTCVDRLHVSIDKSRRRRSVDRTR